MHTVQTRQTLWLAIMALVLSNTCFSATPAVQVHSQKPWYKRHKTALCMAATAIATTFFTGRLRAFLATQSAATTSSTARVICTSQFQLEYPFQLVSSGGSGDLGPLAQGYKLLVVQHNSQILERSTRVVATETGHYQLTLAKIR